MKRAEAAQREERHVGDAGRRKFVDEDVIGPIRKVVRVLHADNVRDAAPLGDLTGCYVAETDLAHQPLALKLGEGGELIDGPKRNALQAT